MEFFLSWCYLTLPTMHKKENIHNAPEHTSLQRKLKEFIVAGGNMDIKYEYKKI